MVETIALIGHNQRENAALFQERIAIIEKPEQVGGVFQHVRPDDPVVGVAATDQLDVRPAIPHEIDLLDIFDVDPMRPIFFDQRVFVAMVEHMNTKALLFRRQRSAARTNL